MEYPGRCFAEMRAQFRQAGIFAFHIACGHNFPAPQLYLPCLAIEVEMRAFHHGVLRESVFGYRGMTPVDLTVVGPLRGQPAPFMLLCCGIGYPSFN